jgi:glutaminyl-peptide cyclotransferase
MRGHAGRALSLTMTVALAMTATAACEGQRAQTAFDGEAAMRYVRTQLAFGPRVPGTRAHVRTGDWITAQMRLRADVVTEQRWKHLTAGGATLELRNILARFKPAATERVLYVTHWDTRPFADRDPDPAKRNRPVPGANDGASGVALFLALGDVLRKTPPAVGVDLLFVDGEDYGEFAPQLVDVLLGSTYFAGHLPSPGYRPLFGVLWDMIADRDLHILVEPYSNEGAPEVVSRVWQTARDLGYGDVFPMESYATGITDDHVPLQQAGLRVIDVIDLSYGPENAWHHTTEDTIDKLSAKSFQIVGDMATALVTGR